MKKLSPRTTLRKVVSNLLPQTQNLSVLYLSGFPNLPFVNLSPFQTLFTWFVQQLVQLLQLEIQLPRQTHLKLLQLAQQPHEVLPLISQLVRTLVPIL